MAQTTNKNMNREWTQATDKARDAMGSAGQMAGHAASAMSNMAGQAASGIGQQADDWVASAGTGLHDLGDRLAEGSPQSGVFGTASQAVANTMRSGGDYIHDAKLSGIAEDVTELIRRNPLPSILIAITVGWCLARRLGS